jgi:hypothetical protein
MSQLGVAQVVRRSGPVLYPVDANRLLHEIDLVPLQIDQLARAEAMAERDKDCRGIPMTIAAVPCFLVEIDLSYLSPSQIRISS